MMIISQENKEPNKKIYWINFDCQFYQHGCVQKKIMHAFHSDQVLTMILLLVTDLRTRIFSSFPYYTNDFGIICML